MKKVLKPGQASVCQVARLAAVASATPRSEEIKNASALPDVRRKPGKPINISPTSRWEGPYAPGFDDAT